MWLSRTNSKTRIPRNPSSSDFSCSSFKDILSLCADEPTSGNPTRFKKSNIFHRVLRANAVLRALSAHLPPKPGPDPYASLEPPAKASPICLPGSETRIVVYITSLRVVRRTFEDCKDVLAILRSFRVSIDERDLSMDPRFLDELKAILGIRDKRKLTLPRVFIGGRYVGGADEIRQLHEAGELKKCAEGLPPANPATCEVCYGHRFTLCRDCNGSRKYYSEKSGFRICTACNENGLIRCSSCSG